MSLLAWETSNEKQDAAACMQVGKVFKAPAFKHELVSSAGHLAVSTGHGAAIPHRALLRSQEGGQLTTSNTRSESSGGQDGE